MPSSRRRALLRVLASSAAPFALQTWAAKAATARSDSKLGPLAHPGKPVRLIVPFAPGGGADVLARTLGPQLSELWQSPVMVENRPGASGILGLDAGSKALPDGHTAVMAIGSISILPALYPKLPFDIERDLTPVSLLGRTPLVWVSLPRTDVPPTLAGFVNWARGRRGRDSYGNFGAGTTSHLLAEQFKLAAQLDLVAVAYKGAGPLLQDLLGAVVVGGFIDVAASLPHLMSGRLQALAITGRDRDPALPQVPTLAECGYGGFDATGWHAVFLPKACAPDRAEAWATDLRRVTQVPALAARLSTLGIQTVGSTPAELATTLRGDAEHWAQVVRAANLSLH